MAVLPMPMVAQTTTTTGDGRPSEDAQYDCVPASIMAGVICLKGLKGWTPQYNPDKLLNTAYPEGYVGPTNAAEFAPHMHLFGAEIVPQKGSNKSLVALAHKQLQAGHPVVFTEPDPYKEGWSHVCCFYGEVDGGLLALDPYPVGHTIEKSDSGWQSTLLYGQIWVVSLLPEQPEGEGTYTIKEGDTLWNIATSHHMTVNALFEKNREKLDQVAKEHDEASSEGGRWIYPGTVLEL